MRRNYLKQAEKYFQFYVADIVHDWHTLLILDSHNMWFYLLLAAEAGEI